MTTTEFGDRYVRWLCHEDALVVGVANLAWAFVARRHGEDAAFVRSVRRYGWRCIREGLRPWRVRRRPVMTTVDRDLLRRLDCDYGQPNGCPSWWRSGSDPKFGDPLPADAHVKVEDFCALRALVQKLQRGAVAR